MGSFLNSFGISDGIQICRSVDIRLLVWRDSELPRTGGRKACCAKTQPSELKWCVCVARKDLSARQQHPCKFPAQQARIVTVSTGIAGRDIHHLRSRTMSKSNPVQVFRPAVIWGYAIAVLSMAAVVIVAQWPALHLQS